MAATKTAPAEQKVEPPSPAHTHITPGTLKELLARGERKIAIQHRILDIERELNDIAAQRAALRPTRQDIAVQALIADEGPSSASTTADSAREATLRDELRYNRAALPLIQKKIDESQSKANRETAEALRPQHREVVREAVFAVVAAARASQAEVDFRAFFRDGGVSVDSHLYPMPFLPFGDLRESSSRVRMYLREARAMGFIDLDELVDLVDPTGKRRKQILGEEPAK